MPDLYEQFVSHFLTITQTYTVKTRRGYHIYFQTQFPISSRKFENYDIKGDGGYVVGAGSIVESWKYEIYRDDNIQMIPYPEDMMSAGAYRRALHRELIRRLSPMIRVEWYANRLGVNRLTIFRYNNRLGVIATPMIEQQPLTMEMIQSLPDNDSNDFNGFTPGMWLQTVQGKRYPALRTIAIRILSVLKAPLRLCKQLPTRYELPDKHSENTYPIQLPDHLKSRGKLLTYSNVKEILSPDWATKKFDLGGYLAVYNGLEWTLRPPFRAIAYQLVKQYEEGLVYFVYPLKQ